MAPGWEPIPTSFCPAGSTVSGRWKASHFYRRPPDTGRNGTQVMRILGAHEGMAMKCGEVGTLSLG